MTTPGRRRAYTALAALIVAISPTAVRAQQAGLAVGLVPPDRIRVSERSNLSTRENGRYTGLLSRQVTGYLSQSEAPVYRGRFFLFEQVRRDMQQVARPVDRSLESTVEISATTLFGGDGSYPSMGHLLQFPAERLAPGARWDAQAWITIDPRRDGHPLRLPVVIDYRFAGRESWSGAPALRVEARFATRYPLPPNDDPDAPVVDYTGPIASVTGSHRVTILLPESGLTTGAGQVAFLRDELTEEYRFGDGTTLVHEGHTLLFLSGLTLESRRRVADEVRQRIDDETTGIRVDETDTGVRLTVSALRFLPDRAVLLPDERARLDTVAAALAEVEQARFLVVGHTADVGSGQSQRRLSVERARTIAAELAARGISPDRIDMEGRGGSEPVATNETEAGRAQNRRVEVYVLEE
ncbi:MAG: OmpA family protein [Spirochaetota bacterium]